MNIFVTVDRNWGIGQQEKRLVSIPADLRTLRDMVAGKVVVIGRKTMETLPFDLVRTARGIYVLSRSGKEVCREAVTCPDVDALKEHLADVPGEDVYVLGGEETFRLTEEALLFVDENNGLMFNALYPGYIQEEDGGVTLITSPSGHYPDPVYHITLASDGEYTPVLAFPGETLPIGEQQRSSTSTRLPGRNGVSPAFSMRIFFSIWRTMTSICLSAISTPCSR